MKPTASREGVARLLLAPVFLVCLVGASSVPWHSATSIDSRTHIEMIRGIVDHGLPYSFNGPVDRYPELQVAWNVARGDRVWGTYPPVFAYASVPAFLIGGLTWVSRFVFATAALLAAGVFMLGRRLTGDPLLGTASAYLTLFGTPTGTSAFDIGPYMLAVTLFAWAAFAALVALDEAARPRMSGAAAFAAGLLAALASGTHMLYFPMTLALVGALGVLPAAGETASVVGGWIARLAPHGLTRGSIRRGALAGLGSAGPFSLIALLNKARFGSWNPASYGPCAWANRCAGTGLGRQTAGAMIAFAGPVLACLGVAIVALLLVRRSRAGRFAVVALACAALLVPSFMREKAGPFFELLFAYTVDVSRLSVPPWARAADGLGNFWGPFVIKSPFQGTPALVLATIAPWVLASRARALLLLAPVSALFCMLAMRAQIPAVHALGFSWLYLRYAMPAMPLLVVLAIAVARTAPWRPWHLVLLVALGLAVGLALAPDQVGDHPHLRRVLLLRATLVVGFLGTALLYVGHRWDRAVARRAAVPVMSSAFALSFALTGAIDLRETFELRGGNDAIVDRIAALTPQRFALVGYAAEIDIPMTLRATRDVEVADLLESKDWANFRALIDHWSSTGRPIYAIWWGPVPSPWPEIAFEPVDAAHNIYRVQKITSP